MNFMEEKEDATIRISGTQFWEEERAKGKKRERHARASLSDLSESMSRYQKHNSSKIYGKNFLRWFRGEKEEIGWKKGGRIQTT